MSKKKLKKQIHKEIERQKWEQIQKCIAIASRHKAENEPYD
jgi:hypothetical protein